VLVHRSVKGTVIGFGRGLLGLYGLVGYASDFLSYTRLAALGLASLLVGDVMNRLAGLVVDIPFGFGILAAVLILVVGHTFNVVINLLGAFVHPTRLQFVEFFSKFYEGGGRPFAPFAPRTKSVVLHPDTGAQEGGAQTWTT
jgi:V/A-type H+/Na+-transporting ATPase subunit I